MKTRALILYACLALPSLAFGDVGKIKVGVQLSLSGDLSALGTDQLHALTVANEVFGEGRFELVVEDDACDNKQAIAIAKKFIEGDRVRAVLGMSCNQALMATAPVYEKAGIPVFSGSATSGDVESVGKRNVRFFPSDKFGAETLFQYLKGRFQSVYLLTEQTEYATMMERSFLRANETAGSPLAVSTAAFDHKSADLRGLILRAKGSNAQVLYLNADSDASFVTLMKRVRELKLSMPIVSVYLASSNVVLKDHPELVEGVIQSNLPSVDELVSPTGKELLSRFRARYGEPLSGFPVVPSTLESFRVFVLWTKSQKSMEDFLRGIQIADGVLPPYSFDSGGNIIGFRFQMERIEGGRVVKLSD